MLNFGFHTIVKCRPCLILNQKHVTHVTHVTHHSHSHTHRGRQARFYQGENTTTKKVEKALPKGPKPTRPLFRSYPILFVVRGYFPQATVRPHIEPL